MAVAGMLSGVAFVGAFVLLYHWSTRRNSSALWLMAGVAFLCAVVCWWVGTRHIESADALAREATFYCPRCDAEKETARAWLLPMWTGLALATLAGWSAVLVKVLSGQRGANPPIRPRTGEEATLVVHKRPRLDSNQRPSD